MKRNDQTVEHGLVISCEAEDAWCLKQQSVEVDPKNEQTVLLANTFSSPTASKDTSTTDSADASSPLSTARKNPRVEIGFAYFRDSLPYRNRSHEFRPPPPTTGVSETVLTMFRHFYEELKKSSRKMNITLAPVFGLDQRTSTHLKRSSSTASYRAGRSISAPPHLDKDDYLLTYLAATGVKEIVHLPCRPIRIEEQHRALAKATPTQEEENYQERLDRLKKKVEQKIKALRKAKGTDENKEAGQ